MIRWATHRPAVAWALAAGLLGSGAVAFGKLPLATRAVVELPQISVSAGWPGSSPELIETWVTSPIEAAVQSVRGVKGTSSTSSISSAIIRVKLDPDADLPMTRLAIFERIEALRPELPEAARQSVRVGNYVPEDQREKPLMTISVMGSITPGALRAVSEDLLEPRLSALPGVASISLSTQIQNGIAISYDPEYLRRLGISPTAISTVVSSSRVLTHLGQVNSGPFVKPVDLRDIPKNIEALTALPVPAPGGRLFTVGQLSSVYPEEDAAGYFYRLNGRTAFTLGISRLPGADAITTAQRIRATLDSIRPLLPPSARARIVEDQSQDLAESLHDLLVRGLIAFGAVLVVLLLGTRNIGGSLVILGSALVAIAGTALGLYLLRIPANLLTLAGLAMGIGILVQNGLVVVERLQKAPADAEGRAQATLRIAPAIIGSTLTTVIVLIPFLYLQDNARAAFVPFATAFALALFWSIGTALFFVPAVSRSGRAAKPWPLLARGNRAIVRSLLRWRLTTQFVTVAVLLFLTWGFIKKVPRTNWGNWNDTPVRETINADVTFPRGSDPKEVERVVRDLEVVALQQPGVAMVTASGSPSGGHVQLTFTPETSLGEEPWIASEALTEHAVLIGGTSSISVSKPQGQGYYNGSGGSSMVSKQIQIMGYSFEGVRRIAEDLAKRLAMNSRIPAKTIDINASNGWGGSQTITVALIPDRQALSLVGATVRDYNMAVAREIQAPSGNGSTKLEINGREIPVAVKARGTATRDIEKLALSTFFTPDGAVLRLGDVSTLSEVPELSTIKRENQRYIRTLAYDFRGPSKLADRTHKAFMASISVPIGYEVTDKSDRWGDDNSAKDLNLIFALGIVLVLLSVAVVFNSVWTAAMVFFSLPIGLGGVVAAYWMTGTSFTREATVGVILVVGLAVNHSILMIDGVLAARRGAGRATPAGVFRAILDRTEMIVLVTLTTLASLVPMAWGEATSTQSGSIALATAGGTIASTLGAIYLFPPILLGWRGLRWRRRRRKTVTSPAAPPGTE